LAETLYSQRVRQQRERIVNCVKQDRKMVYVYQFLNIPRLGRRNIVFARKVIEDLRNAMNHDIATVKILDDLQARADAAMARLENRKAKKDAIELAAATKAAKEAPKPAVSPAGDELGYNPEDIWDQMLAGAKPQVINNSSSATPSNETSVAPVKES
jgi:hypothetical protein